MLYVLLGHRVANTTVRGAFGGIDQLGAAIAAHQVPSVRELAGIALVIAGVAIHQADAR